VSWQECIAIDPEILDGKPHVTGTRVAVETVLELLARDWTEDMINREHPEIRHPEIAACIHYALERIRQDRPNRIAE
jgi:uncharacterized protein (DUF433 family)